MATTGYQAGVEANDTNIRYGVEATWGTAPAVAFQSIRYTSETMAGQKTRARPQEINQTREESGAITTQEVATGLINWALSYGTFDDFFASLFCGTWQTPIVITGNSPGDITITSGTNVLSSTTPNLFVDVIEGQWIRLFGFTNAGNNGYWKVVTKTDNTHLVLAGTGTIVTETPATAEAEIRASTLLNGTTFTSLFIEQQLSSSLYLQYPGSYVTSGTISGALGQFIQGSFTMASKVEQKATSTSSTGSVVDAPTGLVHNTVGGFGGVLIDQAILANSTKVTAFNINITNAGAAAEFALGSSFAAGILKGAFGVSGSVSMYFKDFTYYDRFKNETEGEIAFITSDAATDTYIFSLPVATLMNPTVDASGPGTACIATFQLEGNPQTGGGTMRIDKLSHT